MVMDDGGEKWMREMDERNDDGGEKDGDEGKMVVEEREMEGRDGGGGE